MTITLYQNDLPGDIKFPDGVAVDTETLGLNPLRDRLCLVQLSAGDGTAHLIQFSQDNYKAPNLKKILQNSDIEKIFHYARFDIAVLSHYLNVQASPIFCTKIASKLTRTYTDRHGLKDICRELVGVDLSKQQQSSDWASERLTENQLEYAASDVLHLHALRQKLSDMLIREKRMKLALASFSFLPTRAELDLAGWVDQDIFSH